MNSNTINSQLRKAERLVKKGEYNAARQLYQSILQHYPKNPTALQGMRALQEHIIAATTPPTEKMQAVVDLYNQGQYQAALQQGQALLKDYPECANLHSIVGAQHIRLGDLKQAAENYRQAINLDPDYSHAHNNYGVVLSDMGQYHAALDCFYRAIEIEPDYASAHFNISLRLLLLGDLANGWRKYEWRVGGSKNNDISQEVTQPFWLGDSDIAGRTIVIHSEQGLGDTLHFSRYVKMVADLGAQVVFEVQAQLAPLFESFKGYAQIVVRGKDPIPAFDVHSPLLSLPLAFATDLDSIPGEIGYLHVSPAKIKHWQARLGKRNKPRVGLVWRGNPTHVEVQRRSLSLAMVLQYLPPDYDYISLQYEVADEDRPLLSQLNHVGEDFTGFDDTAAVCTQLDLLICVDTSVAHLGGVLGLPTWILLPYSPDFRWLLERTDSPWYPSVRLFRQPELGDWSSVLTAVAQALGEQQYD